ncbi:MAG: hypothetical protein ABSA21_12360 [Candidatus Limnocylindrales bacterium]|jgi:hypothetical protein
MKSDADVTAVQRVRPWYRLSRGDLLFVLAVLVAYGLAAVIAIIGRHLPVDRIIIVAISVVNGHFDASALKGSGDTVELNGRYYLAVGPLQILPYLPFALFHLFHNFAGHLIGLAFGIPAAWLALPLARAYGARGASAYWIAAFIAFGSLLLYVSVFGDIFYLAHAECFLALTLFLLEWAGRRRPAVLGLCMAFSFLARPTTILAIIPFGLVLLWQRRDRIASAIALGMPLAAGVAIYGWYNWVRFDSPLEAGYLLTYLPQPALVQRRDLGLFSILQIPENLRLALLALPESLPHFPFLTASPFGLSMLFVSPALVTALWSGFRDHAVQLLWLAAALVAVPVFLYYGGGYVQYGFRYSLDFTPFLVALMAMGSSRWKGWPERLLVVVSVASVAYGVLWHSFTYLQS